VDVGAKAPPPPVAPDSVPVEVVREPLEIPGPAGARFVAHVLGQAGQAANALAERADVPVRVPTSYDAAEDVLTPMVARHPWAVVAALGTALGVTAGVVFVALHKLWRRARPTAEAVADVAATTPQAAAPRDSQSKWSPV